MGYRRIIWRRPRNRGQHCGFFNVQIFKFLAEVVFSCRGKPVLTVSHEVQIAIHGEDLLLRIEALDLNRKHRLLDLSPERSLRRQKQVLAQLLSQRAATFNHPPCHDVFQTGSGNTVEIDAPVCEEVLVFN